MDRIVIVGASLAGLRAAEELRGQGFGGTITLVGAEPHRPYDRPPLSKHVLAGKQPPEATELGVALGTVDELDLTWRLGESATGLELAPSGRGGDVLLGGGERLPFDGLVICTGATPRHLPGTDHLDGVHSLRTLDDCAAIRAALEAGPKRVVVVGAGFIGAEVAATARGLGLEVTLVEALPVPLERGVGPVLGQVVADLHRDHGVDVHLGVGVVRMTAADGSDRVAQVTLTDGSELDVDLVVVGVGVTPNTEWLEGSGVPLDNGVLCDETCLSVPGVVAAGDVARWPNPRFGETMRIEHWDNAVEMGAHAARTLLADAAGTAGEPYAPIPWFWSDQYDKKIQLAGRASAEDDVAVVAGSVEERKFVAFFGRGGRLVGVLGMSMPAKVMRCRALVDSGATWDEALAAAAPAPEGGA